MPTPIEKKRRALHDAFFRRIVLDRHLCQSFLKLALTEREVELFDLTTLKAELGTFIDQDLKEHRSDVMVSLQFKNSKLKAKVFFLLEHKSYRDSFVLVQMLKYQAEIYSQGQYRREQVPIYPILVHQGKRPWNFSGNFQDYSLKDLPIEARKILKKRLLDFSCSYLDLSKVEYQKKVEHRGLELALFVMRNIWTLNDKTVEQVILFSKDLLGEYQHLIRDILSYITKYDKRYSRREKLLKLEDNVLKEDDKFMKDISWTFPWEDEALERLEKACQEGMEKGMQKGIQKGMKKGLQKGLEEVAIRMLREGIDLQEIHKFTQLSQADIKKLARRA